MSDIDPRDTYREASKRYQEATASASRTINLIKLAANGLSYHLPTFLGTNFSLGSQGFEQRHVKEVRCDIQSWPNGDELRTVFTEWHSTFIQLHEAWDQIPHGDQAVMAPPPKALAIGK